MLLISTLLGCDPVAEELKDSTDSFDPVEAVTCLSEFLDAAAEDGVIRPVSCIDGDFGSAMAAGSFSSTEGYLAISAPNLSSGYVAVFRVTEDSVLPVALYGSTDEGVETGASIAAADLDGDGTDDLLIGAESLDGAYVLPVSDEMVTDIQSFSAVADFVGTSAGDGAGSTVTAFSSDGVAVVGLGTPGSGVYVVDGSAFVAHELPVAVNCTDCTGFANALASGSFLAGPAVAVSAIDVEGAAEVYIVGVDTPDLGEASTISTGALTSTIVLAAGDLDGDGFSEVVVGLPELDTVLVYDGSSLELRATVTLEGGGGALGEGVGVLDDGTLAVGAPDVDEVWLLTNPEGEVTLTAGGPPAPPATGTSSFIGDETVDHFGAPVVGVRSTGAVAVGASGAVSIRRR